MSGVRGKGDGFPREDGSEGSAAGGSLEAEENGWKFSPGAMVAAGAGAGGGSRDVGGGDVVVVGDGGGDAGGAGGGTGEGGVSGTFLDGGNPTSQVLFTFPLVPDVELLVMQEDVDFVQRIVVVRLSSSVSVAEL